jgi:hypothetical protein
MSAAFYNKMATTARDLLLKFGSVVTVTRTTGESINPVTGVVSAGTTVTFSPKGILQNYNDKLVDNTRILSGDRRMVLDDTVAPLMSDQITIESELWTIVGIEDKTPAAVPLVYICQLRK